MRTPSTAGAGRRRIREGPRLKIRVAPDPFATLHDSRKFLFRLLPARARKIGATGSGEAASDTAVSRMQNPMASDYRPPNLEEFVVARRGAVSMVAELIANRAAGSSGAIA